MTASRPGGRGRDRRRGRRRALRGLVPPGGRLPGHRLRHARRGRRRLGTQRRMDLPSDGRAASRAIRIVGPYGTRCRRSPPRPRSWQAGTTSSCRGRTTSISTSFCRTARFTPSTPAISPGSKQQRSTAGWSPTGSAAGTGASQPVNPPASQAGDGLPGHPRPHAVSAASNRRPGTPGAGAPVSHKVTGPGL